MQTADNQALEDKAGPLVTLAIPTYNRAMKVERVLRRTREMFDHQPWTSEVEILVCDNASPDDTQQTVERFQSSFPCLRYYRQATNVGFDGNVMECYRQAKGQYVCYQSDDDLPDVDAMQIIVQSLRQQVSDVLRFSFRQPADALTGAFQFPEPLHLESRPVECIELAMRFPKLSTYVLRRVEFDEQTEAYHRSTIGDGFSFVILALSVLQHSSKHRSSLKVAVVSRPLASCDADYKTLDWPPSVILNSYRQAEHPYVQQHNPKLASEMKYRGYMDAIELAYQVNSGQYGTTIPHTYQHFGASVPYRFGYLIKRPKLFLRLWRLKRKASAKEYQPVTW